MTAFQDHHVRLMGDTELIAENQQLRAEVERCHARLAMADTAIHRLHLTIDVLRGRLATVSGRLRAIADHMESLPAVERPDTETD